MLVCMWVNIPTFSLSSYGSSCKNTQINQQNYTKIKLAIATDKVMTPGKVMNSYGDSTVTVLQTSSGPGWSNHVCGMDSEASGVTSNAWKAPWMGYSQDITPVTTDKTPMPCIFRHLKVS